TRKRLLEHWAEGHWEFLANLAGLLAEHFPDIDPRLLADKKQQAPEYTELFVIDPAGRVLASTHDKHVGKTDLAPNAVARGLKGRFLHGPYVDALTRDLGPGTSRFHDAVTLMLYHPLVRDGVTLGCLCGRIPNDVMGDLIQREAGHVYKESGDNYVFMVESRFDPSIRPGTALSRSRFEDDAFTLGDNLKQGVQTKFGTVRVREHTELELVFTDPATGQLHPGVRETIRRGENLFVTYPGYSDYRHIPVIGKGVTFSLPGSPDRWGMMCEGDLEEVYRHRSINLRLLRLAAVIGLVVYGLLNAQWQWLPLGPLATQAVAVMLMLLGFLAFHLLGTRPLVRRLETVSDFFLDVAESGGTLKQRIDTERFAHDQAGDLARWANSFIDKIDDTVNRVLDVAARVATAAANLTRISGTVAQGSRQQSEAASTTAAAVEEMTATIAHVADHSRSTESTSESAQVTTSRGREVVGKASQEMQRIASTVQDSSSLIRELGERSNAINGIVGVIREIADQTNLLALNAAIEAARAGEQGRGFAVVADEVRTLASRTARATGEIGGLITDIRNEIERAVQTMEGCAKQAEGGVELAAEAGRSLDEISTGVDHTLGMVRDIAQATRQQNQASEEIARNVDRIAGMAEGNHRSVIESSHCAHTLELLAADLQGAVSKFTV
ncbi:MAG: methyl-accepting chemotaxis protein, partial [Chromatiales bacterium]|nr:methyl-accepting chemotaxis protein [Chromatiales bacterium]